MTDDAKFDCFLSHNSNDKHTARTIKSLLAQRGLAAWIDEDELPPGTKWQNGLSIAIRQQRELRGQLT
ncbi:toll/interleukin-1 receptor domain-containing protein [uncultured Thiodictyon sp.]|jgi:hypothetical protein|uniref:toll/interleukin-1 receptor domain-containing protein n=1 Tax=uncultured Thiodictyon sp. TaxID=1846217 RepID=UPI003457F55C